MPTLSSASRPVTVSVPPSKLLSGSLKVTFESRICGAALTVFSRKLTEGPRPVSVGMILDIIAPLNGYVRALEAKRYNQERGIAGCPVLCQEAHICARNRGCCHKRTPFAGPLRVLSVSSAGNGPVPRQKLQIWSDQC